MRSAAARRLAPWVDLVGDLLLERAPAFPVEDVLGELRRTFDAHVSWNWAEPDGSYGFHAERVIAGWPTPQEMELWGHEAFALHPLVRWFTASGDLAALTIARVPRRFRSAEGLGLIHEQLDGVGLEQQLSIPYRVGHGEHRAFVLATSGADFDDEDLALARQIQPLMILLARQHAVLDAAQVGEDPKALEDARITGREFAVLQLLSQGLTAETIGRRLGISPRTVHVHLDHLYRKLAVHDRLMAVRAAREAGLLADAGAARPCPPQLDDTPSERRFSWSPVSGAAHRAGTP